MIPLPGDCRYQLLLEDEELGGLYDKLRAQDLLWAVWPEWEKAGRGVFIQCLGKPWVYVLGAFIAEDLAGALILRPFGELSLVGEIGVTAFRPYFKIARQLFLNALLFLLKNLDPAPAAFVGRVARVNRHIFAMLLDCGFKEAARLPGLMWHARQRRFVEGALVTARAEDIFRLMEE